MSWVSDVNNSGKSKIEDFENYGHQRGGTDVEDWRQEFCDLAAAAGTAAARVGKQNRRWRASAQYE